jgi:DNA polymerase-3 subunit alpha
MSRAAGLVKFDFLGLKTLTVLNQGVELLASAASRRSRNRCRSTTPTYELLQRGDTVGVFQLESQGMRDTLRKMKRPTASRTSSPRRALPARPDGQHPDLHRAASTGEEARIPAPEAGADPEGDLRRHRLSGTGDADRPDPGRLFAGRAPTCCAAPWARRSRRRWTRSARASSRARKKRAIEAKARRSDIFDLIDKFAGYGFNKSHAAAYALLAYQTAWLKAQYPARVLRRLDVFRHAPTPTS